MMRLMEREVVSVKFHKSLYHVTINDDHYRPEDIPSGIKFQVLCADLTQVSLWDACMECSEDVHISKKSEGDSFDDRCLTPSTK